MKHSAVQTSIQLMTSAIAISLIIWLISFAVSMAGAHIMVAWWGAFVASGFVSMNLVMATMLVFIETNRFDRKKGASLLKGAALKLGILLIFAGSAVALYLSWSDFLPPDMYGSISYAILGLVSGLGVGLLVLRLLVLAAERESNKKPATNN